MIDGERDAVRTGPHGVRQLLVWASMLTVALVSVPAAGATNILHNPGFETDCSGIPCSWTPSNPTTIARDTSSARTGAASLRVTPAKSDGPSDITVLSGAAYQCVSPVTAGDYTASFWYRAGPDPGLERTDMFISSHPDDACSDDPLAPLSRIGETMLNGAWNHASGNLTAPAGTQSVAVVLVVYCDGPCNGSSFARFDDVVLDGVPTAVTLLSVQPTRSSSGVLVRWRTASESGTLGFNVWRYRGGKGVKVNRTLIAAKRSGEPAGAGYSFVDRAPGARRGLTYRLQLVDQQGRRTWYAPFAAAG
ncbi:MAG: hypothetical protein ABR521_05000 [Gaiellaceae bacterium]